MAAAQLRGQRHNAHVVQGPVGGQHVVKGIGLKGAQVGLGVRTTLLPADKRAFQVQPWEGGSRWLQQALPWSSCPPSLPCSWASGGAGAANRAPRSLPGRGRGKGQPLTEDPCPMGTTTLHRDLRKDLGGTSR